MASISSAFNQMLWDLQHKRYGGVLLLQAQKTHDASQDTHEDLDEAHLFLEDDPATTSSSPDIRSVPDADPPAATCASDDLRFAIGRHIA